MPVKLLVTKRGSREGDASDAFVFDQDRITIGRDSSNLLVLPDERKVVGRQHAEIHQSGNMYQLVDLGSKNFTYLQGERLEARRPHPLEEGDVVRIGDFEILFSTTAPVKADRDRTVFVSNPFQEFGEELIDVLTRMEATYADMPGQRDAALREAVRLAADGQDHSGVLQGIVDALGGAKAGSGADDDVVDALVEFASSLAGIPSRFRHEFIGQTIAQSRESSFLYDGDPDTLERYLTDPTISEEERHHRLHLLKGAADELAMHQVALLDGYKASILNGVVQFLDFIDPDTIEQQLVQEQAFFRVFPFLAKLQVVRRLKQACRELRSEDWAAAERRVFRPAFVRAYLARMTSLEKTGSDTQST